MVKDMYRLNSRHRYAGSIETRTLDEVVYARKQRKLLSKQILDALEHLGNFNNWIHIQVRNEYVE